MTIEAFSYREGKWWIFEIPSLTSPSANPGHEPLIAIGQAETAAELPEAIADVASLWTGKEYTVSDVVITFRAPAEATASS